MANTNLKLIETYYDKEKKKINERYYVDKDGLKQGLYESFYENGQPHIKFTCKDGVYDGLFELFYKDGQVKERCTHKDDKLDLVLNHLYPIIS